MTCSCCLYELKVNVALNVARSRIGCCCWQFDWQAIWPIVTRLLCVAVAIRHLIRQTKQSDNKHVRCSQLTSVVNWKMVKRCTYVACNADSRYPERLGNTQFHPFPKPGRNLEKCMKWISLCGRPQQQLCDKLRNHSTAKHIYVCSKVTVIHAAPFCSTSLDSCMFYKLS